MPTVLEGSFEFFMNLLSSPLATQTDLQRSLLSLLVEFVGWSPSSRIPIRTPPLMYKHLLAFMNLLVFSQISDIKDQAYRLAQAAMLSTGAFDRNQHEIASWFLFLPGFDREKSSVQVLSLDVLQSLCHVVNSFLCDAISTTGNNLFKYWEIVKRYTRPLEINKGNCYSSNLYNFSIGTSLFSFFGGGGLIDTCQVCLLGTKHIWHAQLRCGVENFK